MFPLGLWGETPLPGWHTCPPPWVLPGECHPRDGTEPSSMGEISGTEMLLNPFFPFTTAKVLALKATVLLLLTLLIKARVRIMAFSGLGFFLLLLQTLVFLAVGGGLVLAAGGAALYAMQQRKTAAA